MPMILKTWGGIWGANDFKTWGGTWGGTWGVKIKKFLIIFLVFNQNDVYELQCPPYRVIIVIV